MHIVRIETRVNDLASAGRFYRDVLQLPTLTTEGQCTVVVGSTRLVLRQDATPEAALHLAFTIPSGSFGSAKRWLLGRVSLLSHENADEFECAPHWNARSLYFTGPDDAVLELIERRELDNSHDGSFDADSVLCISEVGIAVADVPATVRALGAAGIHPFGTAGEQFAPLGDHDGLLVIVAKDRTWFPTSERLARELPLRVTVSSGVPPIELPLNPVASLVMVGARREA